MLPLKFGFSEISPGPQRRTDPPKMVGKRVQGLQMPSRWPQPGGLSSLEALPACSRQTAARSWGERLEVGSTEINANLQCKHGSGLDAL